ncbi:hypothetical protein UFOVP221_43 [uncultured Caudovirales phage]|uniref:Uncharacterized protein n=1 Tax=uncultured Caudovirales phage TaxID=2100421 RepID=A0A6J7WSX7_9CAUD|nr:hypothetical protein UFOVP221_43 [uncultured Caudovirales phage]
MQRTPNHTIIRKGTILYHGTDKRAIKGIKQGGLDVSSDQLPPGASGAWVTPSFNVAREYGGDVAHFTAKQDLIIHHQPEDSSELGQMRNANRLVNEENDEGRHLDPDEMKDYGYEGADRSKAADISSVLEKQGFHGHWDPWQNNHEMAIYNPEHLEFSGWSRASKKGLKFHPALGRQWQGE